MNAASESSVGMSELSKRVLTGVVGGAALVLLICFGGRSGIVFLTAVLSIGMTYEFGRIAFALTDEREKRFVLLSAAWVVILGHVIFSRAEFGLVVTAFLGLFGYFLFTAGRHEGRTFVAHFGEFAYAFVGIVYLAFLPQFLPKIHESVFGVHWTLVFLLIVWAGDTGAYFVGKRFGSRKLYQKISPKKTVEGAFGGLAAGLIAAFLYKVVFFRAMGWGAVFFIPLVVGGVSQVGDLCESFFKRAFDRKDSGSILPGHGGFLDRFDGVVFALPVMYACIRLLS